MNNIGIELIIELSISSEPAYLYLVVVGLLYNIIEDVLTIECMKTQDEAI